MAHCWVPVIGFASGLTFLGMVTVPEGDLGWWLVGIPFVIFCFMVGSALLGALIAATAPVRLVFRMMLLAAMILMVLSAFFGRLLYNHSYRKSVLPLQSYFDSLSGLYA